MTVKSLRQILSEGTSSRVLATEAQDATRRARAETAETLQRMNQQARVYLEKVRQQRTATNAK